MAELEKVVYVEDDPDIRQIAAIALEDVAGFTLKSCESGEEALREVKAFAPQMILLDVMMPGMDGTETLAALREQGSISPSTLVVFMTAKVHPDELQRYETMGVEHVIAKPFDPMTLGEEIQKIWETSNG